MVNLCSFGSPSSVFGLDASGDLSPMSFERRMWLAEKEVFLETSLDSRSANIASTSSSSEKTSVSSTSAVLRLFEKLLPWPTPVSSSFLFCGRVGVLAAGAGFAARAGGTTSWVRSMNVFAVLPVVFDRRCISCVICIWPRIDVGGVAAAAAAL